jgi:hypothetical protein
MASNYDYTGDYAQVGNASGQPGDTPAVNLPHGLVDPVAPGRAGIRHMASIDGRTGQSFADVTANRFNGAWARAISRTADPGLRDHLAFLTGAY